MLLRDITVDILNPSMFKINSPCCLSHGVSSVRVCVCVYFWIIYVSVFAEMHVTVHW